MESRRALISAALLVAPCLARAQAQSDSLNQGVLSVMGFVDAYYAYDFGHSANDDRPPFLYQYDRHNEVDLNLGLLHVGYARQRMRAALGLMAGTYPQANLMAEPEMLRNVYEARVGLKLSQGKSIWLDAGIFPSHIGLESALGIDNWTLTRTMIAENSPYYLSGARLTWTVSSKLEVAALVVNGWQRIRRVQNNTPCVGTQLVWTPRPDMKFNWSTFAGSDVPDSLGYYRAFNNLYWIWEGSKWGVQLGGDIGLQENARGGWSTWGGVVGIVRRKLGEDFAVAVRAEHYNDPDQVMVPTGTRHGLTAMGYSLGLDFKVIEDGFVRIEGRTFHGTDEIFEDVHGSTQDNTAITASMAVRF